MVAEHTSLIARLAAVLFSFIAVALFVLDFILIMTSILVSLILIVSNTLLPVNLSQLLVYFFVASALLYAANIVLSIIFFFASATVRHIKTSALRKWLLLIAPLDTARYVVDLFIFGAFAFAPQTLALSPFLLGLVLLVFELGIRFMKGLIKRNYLLESDSPASSGHTPSMSSRWKSSHKK